MLVENGFVIREVRIVAKMSGDAVPPHRGRDDPPLQN